MKKILATLCAVLITTGASAQMMSGGFRLDERSVYYGLRLGFNSSHLGGDFDTDAKTGLNLGAVLGLKCSPHIPMFLESGLYFTERGGKLGKYPKFNLSYLEIPFLMKYGIGVADQFAILPFIGPTFALGVSGQTKESHEIKHDSFGSDRFKRFDVGIKLGCGVEWNMIYAELGYQWGITNISDFPTDDDAFNRTFFMNIGVNF